MGTSVVIPHVTGAANVHLVLINADGEYANTATQSCEAYNSDNIANYGIDATEDGSTGLFRCDFPDWLPAGNYTLLGVDSAGASLAESDFPPIGAATGRWDGTDLVDIAEVVATLASHTSLLNAISVYTGTTIPGLIGGLNDFNPSADTVQNVTNVSTVNALAGSVILNLATAVWALAGAIDGKTPAQAVQIIAALAGKLSGAGTGTETLKGLDGSTDRITATIDASGNRTAVTFNTD